MKRLLVFVFIGATLWSCDRCRGVDCVNLPTFAFRLVRNGQNVSGDYPQARLYTTTGLTTIDMSLLTRPSATGSCLIAFIPTNAVSSTLYLQLSSTDTDTINVDTRTVMENCCTSIQPTSIRFNGQETVNQVDADYCHLFVKR